MSGFFQAICSKGAAWGRAEGIWPPNISPLSLRSSGPGRGGDNGTYFQNLTLASIEPQGAQTLTAVASDGRSIAFRWLDDFVGLSYSQQADARFDADAVFVGHGISAPEYQWDDYSGVDVRGKVVVMFTNEPPSEDPAFFAGGALTYYGRWTYKYEEATRRGAVAAILIHTTPTASYGWNVLRQTGRGDAQVKRVEGAPALAFAGWMTQEAGDKVAATVGKTSEELLKMADTRGFKAFALPVRFRGRFVSKVRDIQTAMWSPGWRGAIRC